MLYTYLSMCQAFVSMIFNSPHYSVESPLDMFLCCLKRHHISVYSYQYSYVMCTGCRAMAGAVPWRGALAGRLPSRQAVQHRPRVPQRDPRRDAPRGVPADRRCWGWRGESPGVVESFVVCLVTRFHWALCCIDGICNTECGLLKILTENIAFVLSWSH